MATLNSGYIYIGSFVKANVKPTSIFLNGEAFWEEDDLTVMLDSIGDDDLFIVNEFQDEDLNDMQSLIQLYTSNRISINLN